MRTYDHGTKAQFGNGKKRERTCLLSIRIELYLAFGGGAQMSRNGADSEKARALTGDGGTTTERGAEFQFKKLPGLWS